jgi:hypothetical protein
MLDVGLYIFYALLGIAVVTAVVFPIVNAIKTPGALLRSLAGIAALLVLFGIAYALSDGTLSQRNAAVISPTEGRLISAGLILFYITLILSALAVIYSEITKALR